MKTAISTPSISAALELISKGLSQERLGSIEPATSPVYTLTRATIANRASVITSAPSRNTCVRAESSIPM